MDKILYGVAYYHEYLPYDRLEEDVKMMKEAGINEVRIAESTWSTYEPHEGEFDFSHVVRVMDAMEEAGIDVIIGTPTYAIPSWMEKRYPDIMTVTKAGRSIYGARQQMDISHPAYLFYCERIIRKLMEVTAHRKCVIGFQIDNETKFYDNASPNVQKAFVQYLRKEFHEDIDAFNLEFGLDYWSNRINSWEDFPDIRGSINGSLKAEFAKFQRMQVTKFLSWQADLVREYAREDQFITHNFDYEWRDYSFGVQPDVNHKDAAKALTIAGTDIYHPGQDFLTGAEIAYGGNSTRSLKQDNYLVIECQVQGYIHWVPYQGQLRLQAYSHLSSGANMVEYWNWHSIHNSAEAYWKGVLSHDLKKNETFYAMKEIAGEFRQIGDHLVNLKKKNKVAMLLSNEAFTALKEYPINMTDKVNYNDMMRYVFDQLYKLNVECDFVWPDSDNLEDYELLVVPSLYVAPESLLKRLDAYVENGGHLFMTFKSAIADEYVKLYCDEQPHILSKCLGISYSHFTVPYRVKLASDKLHFNKEDEIKIFMEMLNVESDSVEVLATYDHYNWNRYAALTRNTYGKGTATYLGCWTSDDALREILADELKMAGLWTKDQEVEFPVIIKRGTNDYGKEVVYYLNYSPEVQKVEYQGEKGIELFTKDAIENGQILELQPWNLMIVER